MRFPEYCGEMTRPDCFFSLANLDANFYLQARMCNIVRLRLFVHKIGVWLHPWHTKIISQNSVKDKIYSPREVSSIHRAGIKKGKCNKNGRRIERGMRDMYHEITPRV